ncbi:MAG TPA: hypothetical protein VJY62_17295 [Bacteroidia bacterium]|nr:hypothetical protein [Bacteroidia bacterium]
MIKRHSPGFIFLNGHGGADCVTGQNEEILVKMNENENVLHGSVTYALSCKSAKTLGQEVVKAGDTAYIGYQEDFFFFFFSAKMARPDTDETAGLFLTPANQVAHSLAKGHNVSESCLITKKYFYKNITKLLTSEASDNDREAISYLLWDMQNLIFHGDGQKKIKD